MINSFFELTKTNIMVEFKILGHEFNPETITKRLLIVPDESWVEGEKIKDRDVVRQYTCWSLSTGYKESIDVKDQLQEIIDKLIPKTCELLEIRKDFNVDYRIDIVINIENNQSPAIYLNTAAVEFASCIKAEFDFDLYVYS